MSNIPLDPEIRITRKRERGRFRLAEQGASDGVRSSDAVTVTQHDDETLAGHHTEIHAHEDVVEHAFTHASGDEDELSHDVLGGVSADDHHTESHTVASHSDTTATGAELETLTDTSDADSLHTHGDIKSHAPNHTDGTDNIQTGVDDRNIIRVDDEEGAAVGDFAVFTEDGVRALSPTEVLQDLSGQADDPFDWNDQEIRNVRNLFIGDDRVEARWSHAITVEDPAATDVIPIKFFFDRSTVQDVRDGTIGSSTTADYNLEWRDTLNGSGTDVFAADVQATTTDANRTGVDFNAPASGSSGGWLVAALSAVSGTAPDFLAITVRGVYAS